MGDNGEERECVRDGESVDVPPIGLFCILRHAGEVLRCDVSMS